MSAHSLHDPSLPEASSRDSSPFAPIIVFDALCVLCSANAQFVLTHDKARYFRLASMQGPIGKALYRAAGIDPANPDTLIVVEANRVLRNSDAVLEIYAHCGWPWRAASALRLIPVGLRDPVYRWIARHRYRIFGRRTVCWVPSAVDRDRIV